MFTLYLSRNNEFNAHLETMVDLSRLVTMNTIDIVYVEDFSRQNLPHFIEGTPSLDTGRDVYQGATQITNLLYTLPTPSYTERITQPSHYVSGTSEPFSNAKHSVLSDVVHTKSNVMPPRSPPLAPPPAFHQNNGLPLPSNNPHNYSNNRPANLINEAIQKQLVEKNKNELRQSEKFDIELHSVNAKIYDGVEDKNMIVDVGNDTQQYPDISAAPLIHQSNDRVKDQVLDTVDILAPSKGELDIVVAEADQANRDDITNDTISTKSTDNSNIIHQINDEENSMHIKTIDDAFISDHGD